MEQQYQHPAYAGVGSENESKPQRVHRSENREQPSTHYKSKKTSQAQLLATNYAQKNPKDLTHFGASKNSVPQVTAIT